MIRRAQEAMTAAEMERRHGNEAEGFHEANKAQWHLGTLLVVRRRWFAIQGDSSLPDEEDVMTTKAVAEGIETPGAAPGSDRAAQRSLLQLILGGFAGTAAFVPIMSFLEPGLISRSSDLA